MRRAVGLHGSGHGSGPQLGGERREGEGGRPAETPQRPASIFLYTGILRVVAHGLEDSRRDPLRGRVCSHPTACG